MIVIIKSLYENELEKISGGVTGGLRGPQAALIISFIPIGGFPGGGGGPDFKSPKFWPLPLSLPTPIGSTIYK